MNQLRVPCSYQGGKQRVAAEIVDAFFAISSIDNATHFYDLCCGSGAITLELIKRGIRPDAITMLDKGPWGAFWQSIGKGEFDITRFRSYIAAVPKDKAKIKSFAERLAKRPVADEVPYVYPILQACSFGGKQIWHDGQSWKNAFFRDYWMPTETSVRRSPANPMQPGPAELLRRIMLIAESCIGLRCITADIRDYHETIPHNAVVYVDPPYRNTTGYAYDFDALALVNSLRSHTDAPIFLSEGEPLTQESFRLSFGGAKGGISGTKAGKHQEWLNIYQHLA